MSDEPITICAKCKWYSRSIVPGYYFCLHPATERPVEPDCVTGMIDIRKRRPECGQTNDGHCSQWKRRGLFAWLREW